MKTPPKHRIRRYQELPAWEKRALIEAGVLLPVVVVRLRRSGLQKLRARIETARPRHQPDPDPPEIAKTASRIAGLVEIASRIGPVRGNCLSRSLTLLWLLRLRGIEADLKVGVRQGEALESHAWVEHEGRPLNDTATVAERYDAFPAL